MSCLLISMAALLVGGDGKDDRGTPDSGAIQIVVMDPLAIPLSCPCVEGYAQRNYEKLGTFLAAKLGRPVKVDFADSLKKALTKRTDGRADLVIGKRSVVEADAKVMKLGVAAIASLTDKNGKTTQKGLIVVPAGDPAKKVADLAGYRIYFGPSENAEKSAAAMTLLTSHGVAVPEKIETVEGCADGAVKILEAPAGSKGAAVISSYAAPLLEGCGQVKKGALRVVGETAPVPFVVAFATSQLNAETKKKVEAALAEVKNDAELLIAIESARGFVAIPGTEVVKKKD